MSKIMLADDAVDLVADDSTLLVGGWGDCAAPHNLIAALARRRPKNLTVIITGSGPVEPLFEAGSVSHIITTFGSYAGRVGAASWFEKRFTEGSMTVELCSQGILAERIRAGGAGIPAFYVEERMVGRFRSTDESRVIDGKTCVLETALRADVSLIGASIADPLGNLSWVDGERNFNETMAYAADTVVVEVAELFDVGWLPAEQVMVPGAVVDRLVMVE